MAYDLQYILARNIVPIPTKFILPRGVHSHEGPRTQEPQGKQRLARSTFAERPNQVPPAPAVPNYAG